jgi:hypothetical protein
MAENKQSSGITDIDELGWLGHGIPAVLGVASLVAAYFAYESHIQITLTVALVVVGGFLPWMSWMSIKRSRGAWSFLIASAIVLGIMTLFGAPKVRSLTGMHIGIALLIPAALGFAAFALSTLGHRYKS